MIPPDHGVQCRSRRPVMLWRHDVTEIGVNILWFEDIVALAAHGGFSRAAEVRHVTQPAFSRRIRALEDWLGVVLVDRDRQPVVLTEAGQWFVAVAGETLARLARMPDDARAVAEAGAATIRFAATHALSLTFLPAWLRGYESRVLAAPVELVSDVLARCEDAMFDGRVQFVLCHAHHDAPGRLDARFPSTVVGRDLLFPVSAPTRTRGASPLHRLDRRDPPAAKTPMLAYSASSGLGRIVATLEPVGGRASTVFTAHLASVLRTMAIAGRGIAWLPRSLVGDDLAARRLVLAAPEARGIVVDVRLYRATGPLAASAEAFWAAVSEPAAVDEGPRTSRRRSGSPPVR